MKAKYYKGIGATAIACVLFFSSCLKDKGYVNFAASKPLIELRLSGSIYFAQDALTESTDTIVLTIAVNLASPNTLSTPLVVQLGFSQADLTAYNAANPGIDYLPFPSGSYVLPPATVTIPAGQRLVEVPITFYKSKLDPSKSYMLPLAILGTNNPSVIINALYPAHYYHFIGNDFAGAWRQTFRRWNAKDSVSVGLNGNSFTAQPTTFSPVSPTEFTVYTGYDGGAALRYDVTFDKDVSTGVAMYTNFQLSLVADDITNNLTPNGVSIIQQPVFLTVTPNSATLPGPYTYAQAVKLFWFQFEAMTSAPRYLTDQFYK